MLKLLLIAAECLLASLALASRYVGLGVLLGTLAVGTTLSGNVYSHLLEKQLNYLAARLTQTLVILVLLCTVFAWLTATPWQTCAFFGIALALSLLPLTAPFILRGNLARSTTKVAQHHSIMILRSLLIASIAQLLLILFSLLGFELWHILPVVALPQLLLASLALVLPLSALQHDKTPAKLIQVTAHNLRSHTLSVKSLKSYLGFALPVAGLAYAAYLIEFGRHRLSPGFIDPSLPLHRQATTLASLTLVTCLFVAILFERAEAPATFFRTYIGANKKLLQAFGISLFALVTIMYVPLLQKLFQSAPPDVFDWLAALLLAALYTACRLLQRHTRQHTRHAIVKLHQELNKL